MCFFCDVNAVTKDLQAFEIKDFETFESNNLQGFEIQDSETFEFQTFGRKWGDNQISGSSGGLVSYSFAENNFDGQFYNFDFFITEKIFQDEITKSFAAWEDVADIRFRLSPDSEGVDIRLGWADIDGSGVILGETTVPSSGPLDSVIVALDVNENWFLSGDAPPNQIDFSSTVTHELGHAIGIAHSGSEQALMNAQYSTTIFDIQQDDIDAAVSIYGANDIIRLDVYRFYNPNAGGHFFTADPVEKSVVEGSGSFNFEGIGFSGIQEGTASTEDAVPIYRFFNSERGNHFFTAFEAEKDYIVTLDDFVFEGVGFFAFDTESSSTVPIYRFFDQNAGGHFFTASDHEKDTLISNGQFSYEGEAFFAFLG